MQPYAKVDIYLKKLYNMYFKQSDDSISTFYIYAVRLKTN